MSLFSQGVLTKKGQALIAKCETRGCGITFQHAVTGAGVHTDTSVETLENRTALIDPKQEFPFAWIDTVVGNAGVVVLKVNIHNRGLEETYVLNELGVTATDPDEGEILYCILVSQNNNVYLPADNETGGISLIREQIFVEVTNASQTVIDTTGAVASQTDLDALRQAVENALAGLTGGTAGQVLGKLDGSDFGYGWLPWANYTGPRDGFPEVGAVGNIYVDTDSAKIYVWKDLDGEGTMGYFNLPLGAEASQILQDQITANRNSIVALNTRTTDLEHLHDEVTVVVQDDEWEHTTEDGIDVYTQEITVTGMTDETEFDVLPAPQQTDALDVDNELKAIGVFWAHGTVDGDTNKILLTCRRKCPAVSFGIKIRGDLRCEET